MVRVGVRVPVRLRVRVRIGANGETWQCSVGLGVGHKTRHEKEVWTKQGRVIKAANRRWYLQGMKLLPKSPLDSSPLGRGTGRGRGYFKKSDRKQELFSEKEQRERREKKSERDRCIC
jgi:hypothetical protein